MAKLLKFPQVASNSMDAVSDRDFALELMAVLSSLGVHLSRLAEDLILWVTEEFGILQLDDAFATGSSLMPQKKNPDVLELIRGQAGVVIGNQTAFLAMMKSLPLSYNRDLQWDKRLLFESVELSLQGLAVGGLLINTVKVRKAHVLELLRSDALCATDLAEHLVMRGMPFSDAHRIVGQVVVFAESQGKQLRDVGLAALQRFSPFFDRKALDVVNPSGSVWRKKSAGSTNPRLVAQALRLWKKRLTR